MRDDVGSMKWMDDEFLFVVFALLPSSSLSPPSLL